ncbi:MAG: hypothetical protein PHN31_02165 [Candidatus Gracilibacteria bacterium]|nr:hypothetical protein [Candidatus Gracilibacteria bacterium]
MEILYNWEYKDKKDRSSTWYIVALAIIIGLVTWGILSKQYGMSLIILLVSGIFYFIENNSEEDVKVTITDLGIQVGQNFYDYSKINGFNYIYEGSNPVFLRLSINKTGLKIIDLDVNEKNVIDTREILGNFINEDSKGELNIIEKLINKLKL